MKLRPRGLLRTGGKRPVPLSLPVKLLDTTGQRTTATSSKASTSARVDVGEDLVALSFASSVRDLTSTGATTASSWSLPENCRGTGAEADAIDASSVFRVGAPAVIIAVPKVLVVLPPKVDLKLPMV